MGGFIPQIAKSLYEAYGDGVSSLTVLFPGRRARLFFNEALSALAGRPMWQPSYTTVDEIMSGLSGLERGDDIRLVTELYSVYSRYHEEPFDTFYHWGEMLLGDFDQVDKYLVDAGMLFSNISDLKELEGDLSYLSAEQRETIARFWKNLGIKHGETVSGEKKKFLTIWNTLTSVYNGYRERLYGAGFGYTGMVHREAVNRIRSGNTGPVERKRYVIAGFNALSECEKVLFDYLTKVHSVDFFWDYDDYYLDDPEQEAGLFLRENVRRYPQRLTSDYSRKGFSEPKDLTVVSVPSDSLQAKYVTRFIREIASEAGGKPDKSTAVVLTDENLLVPVLWAVPSTVRDINVTMGYPLKLTLAYSFTERLLELQSRRRVKDGKVVFYHADVTGLLNYPFVRKAQPDVAGSLLREIVFRQRAYVDIELPESGDIAKIFAPAPEGWRGLASYIRDVISGTVSYIIAGTDDAGTAETEQSVEFFTVIADNIGKVSNSLEECSIEVSERVFASLLRKVLQTVRIPYEGEPLQGIQIMGILETRNLDFENVLMLSVNDDTFPGNRSGSYSFIPYNLRAAYGLPTPAHHEGVFAYYFYRLIQRAKNVHLAYCSRSDEKSSGEQSRYIYQLEYESPHRNRVRRLETALDVALAPREAVTVGKEKSAAEKLNLFLGEQGSELSPTALFNYVACPLKFYFYSVAGMRPSAEIDEEVDAPMFGSILHGAMERLYRRFLNKVNPQERIRSLIGTNEVEEAVKKAIGAEYYGDESTPEEEYGGNLLLIREVAVKYINSGILPFDAGRSGFVITELEKKIGCQVEFDTAAGKRTARFKGIADRIDTVSDGTATVVDYKTGCEQLEFKGVDALFAQSPSDHNSAALQTFLYAMMLNRRTGKDVCPSLYFVRSLNSEDYSPLLTDRQTGCIVDSYLDYKSEFESALGRKLSEIFDLTLPFTQCADPKPCKYCDFNNICKR